MQDTTKYENVLPKGPVVASCKPVHPAPSLQVVSSTGVITLYSLSQGAKLSPLSLTPAGSHGFMRVHPPHAALERHMEAEGAQQFPDVESRPDDRLVRAWLVAKCKQDFRWC